MQVMILGLSKEALERRRGYICASDAAKIMAGQWREVWREKMGLAEGDDLSDKLAVQMGSFTEPFNLWWCERQTGRRIQYYSDNPLALACWELLQAPATHDDNRPIKAAPEFVVSPDYPWMGCSLDGMTHTAKGERCVIDAKHVGAAGDPMILRYTAAGTHQATVMGCDWWALSVFIGNSKWELIEQRVDPLYQAELIAAEEEFWGYVERGEEPEDRGDAILPPKPTPRLREVHVPTHEGEVLAALMRENNWLGEALKEARVIADTDGAAKRHAIARKEFGALIPGDVGLIEWGLFKAKRDKAGALRVSLSKEKEDENG